MKHSLSPVTVSATMKATRYPITMPTLIEMSDPIPRPITIQQQQQQQA